MRYMWRVFKLYFHFCSFNVDGCSFEQFGFGSDIDCLMDRIVVDKLVLDKPVVELGNLKFEEKRNFIIISIY